MKLCIVCLMAISVAGSETDKKRDSFVPELDDLLHDEKFIYFVCETSYSPELIDFLTDAERYKMNSSDAALSHIYNTYIAPGSESEINISAKRRMSLESALLTLENSDDKKVNSTLFDNINTEVKDLLGKNFIQRYIKMKAKRRSRSRSLPRRRTKHTPRHRRERSKSEGSLELSQFSRESKASADGDEELLRIPKILTKKTLLRIVEHMLREHNGIEIMNRRHNFKRYTQCFVSSDFVNWLAKNLGKTRNECIQIGVMMIASDVMRPVGGRTSFENGYYFYEFTEETYAHFPHIEKRRKELSDLCSDIFASADAPKICDRRHHLRTYTKCFIGSELISWLTKHRVQTRTQAVALAKALFNEGLIVNVAGRLSFSDGYFFYRFTEKAMSRVTQRAASAPELLRDLKLPTSPKVNGTADEKNQTIASVKHSKSVEAPRMRTLKPTQSAPDNFLFPPSALHMLPESPPTGLTELFPQHNVSCASPSRDQYVVPHKASNTSSCQQPQKHNRSPYTPSSEFSDHSILDWLYEYFPVRSLVIYSNTTADSAGDSITGTGADSSTTVATDYSTRILIRPTIASSTRANSRTRVTSGTMDSPSARASASPGTSGDCNAKNNADQSFLHVDPPLLQSSSAADSPRRKPASMSAQQCDVVPHSHADLQEGPQDSRARFSSDASRVRLSSGVSLLPGRIDASQERSKKSYEHEKDEGKCCCSKCRCVIV